MQIGRIAGQVNLQSAFGAPARWVQVRTEDSMVTARDLVGAKNGDLVLFCTGDPARLVSPDCPCDAAIVGVVADGGNCG